LWAPTDTRVITFNGADVGWVEPSTAGPEIFLKQIYVVPALQRRGIGTGLCGCYWTNGGTCGRRSCLACSRTTQRAGCMSGSDLWLWARPR
jgi:hypothetical protein